MYIRYQIGNPSIKTESVVQKLEVTDGKMPGWGYNRQQRSMSYCLGEKDLVYGLGETVRGMNKRGWRYISNNADETFHEEEKNSLYSSHNFFVIISAGKSIGIYVDTPGVVEFDIGYTKLNQIILRFEEFDADLYYKEGRSPQEVIREFRELTGRSYIPPRWAFGYGQSRFSYMDEDEIRTLIKSYKKAGFPIDSVYLDIDYMEEFKSGSCSVTTGTGAYLIATVDSVPEYLSEDIICNYSAVKEKYILECSVLTCCSAFDWYIRNFYDWKKPDYDAINFALSKKYSRRSSCMVLPYFQGRGTPDWNATANATFHKINLGHDREDILKALLEGIFVEIDNNMDNLRKYVDITQASISGGLANSRIMNQMQADVYGIPLSRLKDTEATANGAFMIGAVSMGLCESLDKAFEQILQYTEKENYSVNMEMHRNYIELKKEMKQLYKKLY